MTRTKIATLLATEPLGKTVTVKGWVKGFRNNQFIALNDGSTPNNVQIVVNADNFDEAVFKKIGYGAGRFSLLELLDAQAALTTARTALIEARLDRARALAALIRANAQ